MGKQAITAIATYAASIAECANREIGQRFIHKTLVGRQYPPEALEAVILNKLRIDARKQIGDFNKVGNVGTNVYSLQNGENNPAPYLPAPITNNIARLNAIRSNPDAWALANGLYRAGNRDLESEYAVAARPWQSPTGMESMQVRTR